MTGKLNCWNARKLNFATFKPFGFQIKKTRKDELTGFKNLHSVIIPLSQEQRKRTNGRRVFS